MVMVVIVVDPTTRNCYCYGNGQQSTTLSGMIIPFDNTASTESCTQRSTMRFLVLLLLLLSLQGYAYSEGITNCGGDKRFRVTKVSNYYKLQLCISRDNCTDKRNFIKLDKSKLCEVYRTIPGIPDGSKTTIDITRTCIK